MFGKLLIYDLRECCSANLNDKVVLQYFINDIIKIMNMKKVGDTIFEYFDETDFNIKNDLVGYSITQIISLSSITIHICEISKSVYIDIFTCCNINDEIKKNIEDLINNVFNPSIIDNKIILR